MFDEDVPMEKGNWADMVEVEASLAYLFEDDEEEEVDYDNLTSRIPLLSFPCVWTSELCSYVAEVIDID